MTFHDDDRPLSPGELLRILVGFIIVGVGVVLLSRVLL